MNKVRTRAAILVMAIAAGFIQLNAIGSAGNAKSVDSLVSRSATQSGASQNDPCGCDAILVGGLRDQYVEKKSESTRASILNQISQMSFDRFMVAAASSQQTKVSVDAEYKLFSAAVDVGFNAQMNRKQFEDHMRQFAQSYRSEIEAAQAVDITKQVANPDIVREWGNCKRECGANTVTKSWTEIVDEKSLLFCMYVQGAGEVRVTSSVVDGGGVIDSDVPAGAVLKPGPVVNGKTCQFINRKNPNDTVRIIIKIPGRDITHAVKPMYTAVNAGTSGGFEQAMVLIRAGSFKMGSENASADERPIREVRITKEFYIGKFEVTQAQWKAIMGNNPSQYKGDKLPVENVSWDDVQEFLSRLNQQNPNYEYRLPTEAEWEYACRAGTQGDYAGNLDEIAWYKENSGGRSHPVGERKANNWGLFDMHGNVWEWCSDWYDANYYKSGRNVDPLGPSAGTTKVNRGGDWHDPGVGSADRGYNSTGTRSLHLGFRLVRETR